MDIHANEFDSTYNFLLLLRVGKSCELFHEQGLDNWLKLIIIAGREI